VLHWIFDGVRHPATHLAQKLIRHIRKLHPRNAALFVGPFNTAVSPDSSLFVQVERELHICFWAHTFHRTETKSVFRQIENHAAIAWLYLNVEEVLKPFARRLPVF
jgi:hypothetical protein